MSSRQKMGGASALVMAATWVVAFAVFAGILMPAGYFDEGVTPVEQARIMIDNQVIVSIGYLVAYVVWGIFQVVLALALYDRLKVGEPALAQTATAIGLIWAGLIIASGMIATHGIRIAAGLYDADAAQAGSVWVTVETVVGGLGGDAGEVLGGLWLLLSGWAALRARALPRALIYLGLVLGMAGVLTVVPLLELAVFLYGLGFIVWFVWIGIVMLRGVPSHEHRTLPPKVA
jgi:hypothetical protein